MRMYALLKKYEFLKERIIEVENLRNMLGIRIDQYKLYSNFRDRILEPVHNELKLKADLYFEFDEIKYGRKIGAIRFRIFTKKLPIVKLAQLSSDPITINVESKTCSSTLIELIPDQHRTKKTVLSSVESFEKKCGVEYVKRNILYCNSKAEKSYAGFLHNALKNDWGHDWELEQNTPVKKKVKAKEVWEREGYASEQDYAQAMFDKQMKNYQNKI